jgi:hypothetical protein
MYLGRYRLGDWLPLRLTTTNGSGVAVTPDATPKAYLWQGGTNVETRLLPAVEQSRMTGSFAEQVLLGVGYTTGNALVVFQWVAGGVTLQEVAYFEVLAGGSVEGSATAMYFFARPEGGLVLRQLPGGLITAGRNPYVP